MKAITAYTEAEYEQMRVKYCELHDAINGMLHHTLYAPTKRYGYAHYTFKGSYTDKLVEALGRHPDSDEIIMLVDGGFSHLGATCTVDTQHMTFSGRVNTD